ncbi:MAG: hypothetical protein ACKOBW_05360 [Planctomycetota bacterium]
MANGSSGTDWQFWFELPLHWLAGAIRNGHDILRVLYILKINPLPAGLVNTNHPWVTGLAPESGTPIWSQNVIYRSPKNERTEAISDETVVTATGRFLAHRVRQSAVVPELSQGPNRRMPHAINYMHGSSHYNSGLIIFNDIPDTFRHINNASFRRELRRFVTLERREVLFLLRDREYDPKQYAYLSCCMRSRFRWFCNPNGPGPRVLWGNYGPYPAANLITGHWADDVFALIKPDGANAVIRPPINTQQFFQQGSYATGRDHAIRPEILLAWASYLRVRLRGAKGGMFFIDRRRIYRDQIAQRTAQGLAAEERAQF